jgi:type II secretory pathway pseudopilin PulG
MRNDCGTTLIEVVVSILLLAMMAAPIMSVVLNGAMISGRTQRRMAAALAVRRVSEHLKAYVTADRSVALGPGIGSDGWNLPGDASGLAALQGGHHALSAALWLQPLEPKPYLGVISYDVTNRMTPSGPEPDVRFAISWTEP